MWEQYEHLIRELGPDVIDPEHGVAARANFGWHKWYAALAGDRSPSRSQQIRTKKRPPLPRAVS
jgi:hypothetical protein